MLICPKTDQEVELFEGCKSCKFFRGISPLDGKSKYYLELHCKYTKGDLK
jgi:hypothetical protein